jgi:protein gp37
VSAGTKIEWTGQGGATWNPYWGCRECAPECGVHGPGGEHGICYAAADASRNRHPIHAGVAVNGKWTGVITRSSDAVWQEPFSCKPGTFAFTCSMGDFAHEAVPLEWQAEAFDVMDRTPFVTYLLLTKRPATLARVLAKLGRELPPNVSLGVTIGHENSVPLLKVLLSIKATKHFLSCEPLLTSLAGMDLTGVDWVIAGGQSGPNAAICNPDWVRDLRDRCVAQGIAFFLKQWGTWASNPTLKYYELDPPRVVNGKHVGSKGGATLDGRLWREFPV